MNIFSRNLSTTDNDVSQSNPITTLSPFTYTSLTSLKQQQRHLPFSPSLYMNGKSRGAQKRGYDKIKGAESQAKH